MKGADIHCSDDDLRALLGDEEDAPQDPETSFHIETCARCRDRLSRLAADAPDWSTARDALSSSSESDHANDDRADGRSRDFSRRTAWSACSAEALACELLQPPSHPEMLGRIGRYEVERVIGMGGMGVVFKAFDTELNRPVAVKVLAPGLAGNGAARQRFAREARAAAAVVHEHVVAIHNVETTGRLPYLVMPFIAGESLQQRLGREGALKVCEILRIGMQTAAGLAAAHAQGLVHRDVKPSNILLENRVERALLTDFGLARAADDVTLTHTGLFLGTPQYMSPEQARGDAANASSDLFSLGSVIYAMCTGRPPFRAETGYGVLRKITDRDPPGIRECNPEIPLWLERIVERLLSKKPEHRFQSAREVGELLECCLAHIQQPTQVPLPAFCKSISWQRPGNRQGIRALIAAVVAVGVTALCAAYIPQRVQRWWDPPPLSPSPEVGAERAQTAAGSSENSARQDAMSWEGPTDEILELSKDLSRLESLMQTDGTTETPH